MKFKYGVGDKVNIKNSDQSGKVLERKFSIFDPFFKGNWFPSRIYSVMIQDTCLLDGKETTGNLAKVYFKQKDLISYKEL